MLKENELVAFILGASVLVFLVVPRLSRLQVREFPSWKLFLGAFCAYVAGWAFTVLEGPWGSSAMARLVYALLNVMEHVCYAAGSVLVALWVWRTCRRHEEART